MNMFGLILVMALAVYALRLTGFLLANIHMPPDWQLALGFVPIATLTALTVASLAGASSESSIRLLATVSAGVAARYTGRAWVCIVVGILTYGLIRFLVDNTG
jgi:branched-subunit amino acid transport protein